MEILLNIIIYIIHFNCRRRVKKKDDYGTEMKIHLQNIINEFYKIRLDLKPHYKYLL